MEMQCRSVSVFRSTFYPLPVFEPTGDWTNGRRSRLPDHALDLRTVATCDRILALYNYRGSVSNHGLWQVCKLPAWHRTKSITRTKSPSVVGLNWGDVLKQVSDWIFIIIFIYQEIERRYWLRSDIDLIMTWNSANRVIGLCHQADDVCSYSRRRHHLLSPHWPFLLNEMS